MKNRIFQVLRVLVCVIVICALLVNVSPIRAKASVAAVTAWLWVNKDIVIACALAALGVTIGTNPEAFNGVVNDCATFLETTTTWVTNGTIAVLGFNDPLLVKSYLPRDLLQTIWEWLFSYQVVTNVPIIGCGSTILANSTIPFNNGRYIIPAYDCTLIQFYYVSDTGKGYMYNFGTCLVSPLAQQSASLYDSDGSLLDTKTSLSKVTYNDELLKFLYFDFSFYFPYDTHPQTIAKTLLKYPGYVPLVNGSSSSGTNLISVLDSGLTANSQCQAAEGLLLGQIQSPYLTTGTETEEEILKIEIAPIYVDWGTGEVSQKPPGSDEKIPWWPVGVPSIDYDDAIQQDQQTGQSGQTDLDFDFETSTDPGTGTDPDTGGGSGDGTGTGTGTGTGNNSIKDFANVSPGDFVFDVPWMDFFPFCIPKDILDLVRVFDADPEAPRFVFDIDFPYMDEPWHIDIDFSAWDPVALVMRRLELLLFVVGLAMATRNYYIRG